MKKRSFTSLLVICMLLVCMLLAVFPVTAAAADTYVAKIGDDTYATFDEAITAANALTGSVTVEIYGKVEYSSTTAYLTGAYDSISFVGKTDDAEISITRNGSNGYISGSNQGNDCTVNFSDLILSKPTGGYAYDAGFMNVYFTVYRVGAVNYTQCTFPNGACAQGCPVTYTNCEFANKASGEYSLWVYANTDVTVTGGSFTGVRGAKMYTESNTVTDAGTLTLKDVNFTESVTQKPAIVLTYGESVTLDGNTYPTKGVFELDLDGAPNGTTVTADAEEIAKITCVNDNGDCGVLVNGKIYTTVAEAKEVAKAGDTVTLLHNSTETVELPQGVTLDKNGYEAANVTEVTGSEGGEGETYPIYIGETYPVYIGETGYETLQAAIDAAEDGDTIQLMAGEFTEGEVVFPKTLKNVTIKGAENHGTTLKDSALKSAPLPGTWSAPVFESEYHGITIDGIVFDNSYIKFTGWANKSLNQSVSYKNWTITNCEFKNITTEAAVYFNLGTGETMENFTFTYNVIDGVTGQYKSGVGINAAEGTVTITGNSIKNVAWNAIQLQNVAADATVVIDENVLASNADEGIVNLYNVKSSDISVNENKFLAKDESQPYICYVSEDASIDANDNFWGIGEEGSAVADEDFLSKIVGADDKNELKITIDSYYESEDDYDDARDEDQEPTDPGKRPVIPGTTDDTIRVEDLKDTSAFDSALSIQSMLLLQTGNFTDVASSDWFYNDIIALVNKGVINGYPDGSFKPFGEVTWGEALKLVMKAVGYGDIAPTNGHWASGFMAMAIEHGLISGEVDLGAAITREEVANLTAQALKLAPAGIEYPFDDNAPEAAVALYAAGIITGSLDNGQLLFRAESTIIRAEMAAVIWRVYCAR